METRDFEERLVTLEREVADLKLALAKTVDARRRWWIEDAGRFADDPLFEEMVRLGRQYRESLRPRSKEPAR